jgi:hypothetical protein
MSKPLKDGERRTMKPGIYGESVTVIAERIDSDTPNIILQDHETGAEMQLTDVGAQDLIERLRRALSILPSSK